MSRYAILSDIHGNYYALQKIIEDMKQQNISGVILLGDHIDYGMQSNEVIDYIRQDMPYRIICNLWGNHERAIMTEEYKHFSSQRGVESAKYTQSILSTDTKIFIETMCNRNGMESFVLHG